MKKLIGDGHADILYIPVYTVYVCVELTPTMQDEAFRTADSDYWGDLIHINKPGLLSSSSSVSFSHMLSLKSISDGPSTPYWWIYY